MSEKITLNDLTNMYEKLNTETDEKLYGFICSENTKILLEKHCENISNQYVPNPIIYGLKIMAVKPFPDDTVWCLNEINYKDVEKNGLASLIKKIAILNNLKLWGLND